LALLRIEKRIEEIFFKVVESDLGNKFLKLRMYNFQSRVVIACDFRRREFFFSNLTFWEKNNSEKLFNFFENFFSQNLPKFD